MTLLHHTRLVLRLVLREPGSALRILRAVAARSPDRDRLEAL